MKCSGMMLAGAALAFSASSAFAAAHVMTQETSGGMILANADGMTLYTFDDDSEGTSVCNGGCAQNWPPFLAEEGAMADDDYTIIERDDGSMQWAYYGKPLYFYAEDVGSGDMMGDGLGGKWHVVMAEED